MIRCAEVRLTIPDNEALTALGVLQRFGVPVATLERALVYRVDVADANGAALHDELRACEGIFNPNKHHLREREGEGPGPGEVWVDEHGTATASGTVTVSGRTLAGVRSLERYTVWRLLDSDGNPVPRGVVEAATAALLCNPAFQNARFQDAR